MEAFLISCGLVALAEIGDRTQLLGVMLVSRFRRPVPVLLGIFLGALANLLLAGAVGDLVGAWLRGPWMRWLLGASFIAFAAWSLLPEKEDDEHAPKVGVPHGVVLTSALAFFLCEMGDKTQIVTATLAARFTLLVPVVCGATLGMMAANTPSVLIGHMLGDRLPLKPIRLAAAALSLGLGVWTLAGGG